MSLSPCSSDLGADIISTLGALTCAADDANFFIQGYDGTKSVLMYINVALDGTVTEQWRADVLGSVGVQYYQALEVGETYLYAQDPLIDTKWYVLDKSDGSEVASRDFADIELGNWKQVNPTTETRTATGLNVVGNYCYFSSWWWVDKNNTSNSDVAQRGAFIVNYDDLSNYSSAPVTDSISNLFDDSTFNESIESYNNLDGRSSVAYKVPGPNHRLAVAAHTAIASGSPTRDTYRSRTIFLEINDPHGTPSLAYNTIIRNATNTRWHWAPSVSSNGGLLSMDSSGFLTVFSAGTFQSIGFTSWAPKNGPIVATEGNLSGWSSSQRSGTFQYHDISIDDAAVDQTKQHSRGNYVVAGISVKDDNNRAYDFKYGSAIRFNDPTDLDDSTSLDMSVLTDITHISTNLGFSATDRPGGGLHASSAGAW